MAWLLILTALNAAYTAALPSATIFYVANVVLHLALGTAAVLWLGFIWRRSPKVAPLFSGGVTSRSIRLGSVRLPALPVR